MRAPAAEAGVLPLGLSRGRDGLLFVPEPQRPGEPLPLVLMLHGAGGNAAQALQPYRGLAQEHQLMLLAPDARASTWDVIMGGYGPDVAFIDQALQWVFDRYPVDPARVVAEGFSDGASYALSLGLTNGDLFTHLVAFAPGFMAPASQVGAPRIFVAHGTHDRVLPIDRCSRRLVPQLQQAGYEVVYEEFDGPHTVPPAIARSSLDWLQASSG